MYHQPVRQQPTMPTHPVAPVVDLDSLSIAERGVMLAQLAQLTAQNQSDMVEQRVTRTGLVNIHSTRSYGSFTDNRGARIRTSERHNTTTGGVHVSVGGLLLFVVAVLVIVANWPA